MKIKEKIALSAALAVTQIPVSTVQASESLRLEEIVVTARKRVELMQDIPIAITALDSEQLDAQGLFSLQDFGSGAIPSLRVQPFTNNPSTLTVAIRGIGQADAGQVTRESGVGIYIDGVYLGRAQGLGAELADIQSVEVLRGPQGTLFGRNAVGGAVSFTTKSPTGQFGLEQTLGTGSDGYFKALTRLSLPAVAGVSTKIDYMKNERDGWVKNTMPGADDFNAVDKEGYRLTFAWEAADNLIVNYAYDDSSIETSQNYFQFYNDPFFFNGGNVERKREERVRFELPLESNVTDQSGHNLTLEWDLNDDLTIKSITSYRDLDEQVHTSYGGVFGFGLITDATVEQEQLSQELQFIGSAFDDSVDYVGGLYYYKEDVTETNENFGYLLPDPTGFLEGLGVPHQGSSNFVSAEDYFDFIGSPDISLVPSPVINTFQNYFVSGTIDLDLSDFRQVEAVTKSIAAFGQLTWTPSVLDERLHLTFGLRYTDDEREARRPIFNGAASSLDDANSSSSVDPAFTAAYDISEQGSMYFRYATAYKAGGTNLRSAGFDGYDPEELETYELGMKTVLLDYRIQLNTAAFWSTYTERQIDFSNPIDITDSRTVNAANDVDIYGFEIDLRAVVVDGLIANLSYVYLGKNNPLQPDTVFSNGALTNFVLPQLPRHAGSLSLDYALAALPFADLDAHLDIVSASQIFNTPLNEFKSESDYTLANLRLSLSNISLSTAGSLKVSAWISNLTDTEYVISSVDAGTISTVYNAPRMTGIDFVYSY